MDNQRILKEGDLVQWYRIEKILGRGGFGVTYLATDTNLDHKVAIKEYMPGWAVQRLPDNSLAALNDTLRRDFDAGVSNFLREARTLVKFRHPNIVRVMAVFEANNTAYLVMEYEEGEEFKSYVQNDAGLDESSLKSLILRIVDGLDQVHQYGFLHRDIKPVNLIIRNDGSPVLLDFGAARPTEAEAGGHTAYVSAGYTPIEQYQEGDGMKVGPWTDIYSLGATLYYAISGKTPVGPTGRLAALVQKSPDPLDPARLVGAGRYSEKFLQAIDWALNFRPADRPQDLSEWRAALDFEERPLVQPQPAMRQQRQASSRRPRSGHRENQRQKQSAKPAWGKWIFATATLLGLAVAANFMFRNFQEQNQLTELIAEADRRFERGEYSDGAPLYRKVLATDPDNSRASSRLREIEAVYVERFESALAAGEIEQAEQSLGTLDGVSSNKRLIDQRRQQLQLARSEQALETRFVRVQSLSAEGKYSEAGEELAALRTQGIEDPRIQKLESEVQDGLAAEEFQQRQRDQQRAAKLRKEAETKRRVAEANRRQQLRQRTYDNHLSDADDALNRGDLETARLLLDKARALQINDQQLSNLESRVVAQENYQRKPLSAYEVSFATGQFNALKLAVESKNQPLINSLTEGTPRRKGLFDNLFDRYTRLDAKIVEIESALDPKRVTAKLRIEAMIMPNGDIVYPSPAYRDSELTLNRERYGWSQIVW